VFTRNQVWESWRSPADVSDLVRAEVLNRKIGKVVQDDAGQSGCESGLRISAARTSSVTSTSAAGTAAYPTRPHVFVRIGTERLAQGLA
jgi:hypothetical protein